MARRSLEVISFPEPYTDLDKAAMIIAYTRALVHNEIPAFQVDVGDDRFLAGTLAVQHAIELGVEESCGRVRLMAMMCHSNSAIRICARLFTSVRNMPAVRQCHPT